MSNGYAGEVRISTKLDNSGMSKDVAKIEKQIARQSAAFDKATLSIKKQEAELAKLRRQLEAITKGDVKATSLSKMETELRRLNREMKEYDKQLSAFNEKIVKAELELLRAKQYGDQEDIQLKTGNLNLLLEQREELRAVFKDAAYEAGILSEKIQEIRMNPETSREALDLADKIGVAEAKLDDTKDSANELKDSLEGAFSQREEAEKASGTFEDLSASIKNLGASIASLFRAEKASEDMKKLGKETKTAGKSANEAGGAFSNLTSRIGRLVKAAFVFNIVRRGLRGLVTYLGNALKTNDQFVKSLGQIKSNLMTAFQPIFEFVLPWINALMNALAQVTAQMAQFISMIFGVSVQKSQESAKNLYEEANALDEVAKAAKEAEKQFADFDTVKTLSAKKSAEMPEVKPGTPMFDTDFSQLKMPKWLEDFWGVFRQSWEKNGQKTIEAFKRALESIKTLTKEIGKSFMEVWTNGTGLLFLNNMQKLLQTILGIIADIADAFVAAWKKNEAGKKLIQAIFDLLNAMLGLIISVGEAFRAAWNENELGERILGNILSIITGIFNIAKELVGRFTEAWDANENGKKILTLILEIFEVITGVIDRIVQSTLEWAKHLNFEPLLESIGMLLESIKKLVGVIGDSLADTWKDTVLPFLGWVIETALPKVIKLIANVIDWIAENWTAIETLTKIVLLLWVAFKGYTIVMAVKAVMHDLGLVLGEILRVLGTPKGKAAGIIGALLIFISLAYEVSKVWSDMSALEKVVSVLGLLTIAAAAAAIAVGALQSAWSLGLAAAAIVAGVVAITASINSATKRANKSGSTSGSISGYSASAFSAQALPPNLPMLAEGTVARPNAPFAAIIGDNKREPEVVSPVSKIEEAVENVLNRRGMNGGGGNENISPSDVYIDGVKLARVMWSYGKKEDSRRGVNLIESGGVLA